MTNCISKSNNILTLGQFDLPDVINDIRTILHSLLNNGRVYLSEDPKSCGGVNVPPPLKSHIKKTQKKC